MGVDEGVFFALVNRVAALEQALVNPSTPPVPTGATGSEGQPASDVFDVVNGLTSQVTDFAARLTAVEEVILKGGTKG